MRARQHLPRSGHTKHHSQWSNSLSKPASDRPTLATYAYCLVRDSNNNTDVAHHSNAENQTCQHIQTSRPLRTECNAGTSYGQSFYFSGSIRGQPRAMVMSARRKLALCQSLNTPGYIRKYPATAPEVAQTGFPNNGRQPTSPGSKAHKPEPDHGVDLAVG